MGRSHYLGTVFLQVYFPHCMNDGFVYSNLDTKFRYLLHEKKKFNIN